MHIDLYAAWGVIMSLSLMLVGGLVLWAYGARRHEATVKAAGLEAEATRQFHLRLARWFFIYGIALVSIGALLLFWSARHFLPG